MSECRSALASVTGQPIRLFAYPYGAVDRQVADQLRRSHEWSLSCDTRRLGDSFDAAQVPRLEIARLDGAGVRCRSGADVPPHRRRRSPTYFPSAVSGSHCARLL